MLNHLVATAAALRPDRRTLVKVQNSQYTATAVKVASVTAEVTATIASATIVPAAIAGASYLQQQIDPHGRYDPQVDALVTAACHGVGYVATSVTALQERLIPDLSAEGVTGQRSVPCDVEKVELVDWDDNLTFPCRNAGILDTYAKKERSPYAKSDDGIEEGAEDFKNISLYTTKELKEKQDGRGIVKDGLGGEGWELVEEFDQYDSETEGFQQERLSDPFAEDRCGKDREAENACRGRVKERYEGQRGGLLPSELPLPDDEEEITQSQIEEKEEEERLCLEAKWISHEAARAERGEETRALDTIMNDGGFLPSVTFMRADMGADRLDREKEFEKERTKYAGQREEGATYVEDIPADILVKYEEKRGRKSEEVREKEVTTGQDNITTTRDDKTPSDQAEAEGIPAKALLEECGAQMEANSHDLGAAANEYDSASLPIPIPAAMPNPLAQEKAREHAGHSEDGYESSDYSPLVQGSYRQYTVGSSRRSASQPQSTISAATRSRSEFRRNGPVEEEEMAKMWYRPVGSLAVRNAAT